MSEKANVPPPVKMELLPLLDMRRRSKSDVSQYKNIRRTSCSYLPEIKVEDCSEGLGQSDEDELDDLPPLGAFRPRSNTCPNDLFHRRKARPPTPPPLEGKKLTWKELSRNPSKEKICFAPHKLSKVSEVSEGGKMDTEKSKNQDNISSCTTKLQKTQISDASSRNIAISRTIGVTECG